MAVLLPHIEDANTTKYIPPQGEYQTFSDEAHYAEKLKEWGLSSKREFWYKERSHQRLVTIKGYEIFGKTAEYNTVVVEFQDGNLSCILPAYLKEMQSSNFGKEIKPSDEETTTKVEEAESTIPESETSVKPKPAKTQKEKKEKPAKLVLPEDKVHFSAKVKQFALSWNHFNEENDEVVVLENVLILQEEPLEIGTAWCAHSKTLKKFELKPGENLEFDGKIVKKSLPKGKDVEDEALLLEGTISYKVNNPSKITKQ